MTNQLSSSDLIILILSIILGLILLGGVATLIILRIRHKKSSKQPIEVSDQNTDGIDKEIRRYKKLRNIYKQKLNQINKIDRTQAFNDLKAIEDAELSEYRNEQVFKINQEIEKNKNDLLKRTLLGTMQSLHIKVINESSVHFLPITEDLKPYIIGKKGQNIRWLSEVTNCNINVDREKPYIEISSPNPVDKQIAINTLIHLIKSHAFDYVAITNVYNKEKKLIQKDCIDTGKEYLAKLNIKVDNPLVYEYVGRLKYRWSFSQNVLEHCFEVAMICEKLAPEFGLDSQIAKEVGFFHDIGKSIDYEKRYDHIDSGIKIAKKCHLPDEVINGILKHHRNNCYDDYVLLTRCADAWSAARAGARHIPAGNKEETINIIKRKCSSIPTIKTLNVDLDNKTIKVMFIPTINNQQTYQTTKYNIFRAIKKDARLNKFNIQFVE